VVRGEVQWRDAPVLVAAWDELRELLTDRWQPSYDLAAEVAASVRCSPSTPRNLLTAASRAGLVQVRRRAGGDPVRVRAWVRWSR
jgi:hypothetical protein